MKTKLNNLLAQLQKWLTKLPEWIPHDKALHFIGGTLIFDALTVPVALLALVFPALGAFLITWYLMAVLITAALGFGKEYWYDKVVAGHTVDIWDAAATTLGGVVKCAASLPLVLILYRL